MREFILAFPFLNKPLLYVHLQMVRSIQNHASRTQVVKASLEVLWIGRVGAAGRVWTSCPLDPHPRGVAAAAAAGGEELTRAILSCAVSEQPSEDIDTNCGPFKSVMY